MKESKVYQLRRIHLPKWSRIRKIVWVFREKEFFHHPAIGIWWKKSRGIGIKDQNKMFKYLMIGLHLGNLNTWLQFTWIGKSSMKKGLFIPEENIEGYIKQQ